MQDGGDVWSTAAGSHHINEQFVDPYQRGQTLGLDEDGELWMKGGDPAATVAYGIDHITDFDFTYTSVSVLRPHRTGHRSVVIIRSCIMVGLGVK